MRALREACDGSARDLSRSDDSAWLARLLVVRSAGHVERSVNVVLRTHVAVRSSGFTKSFAQSYLERGINPSPDALLALTGRFDATLEADLREFLQEDDQRLHREMAFLVDRRNKIAHGLNESVGVVKAIQLTAVASDVADWFVRSFDPIGPVGGV